MLVVHEYPSKEMWKQLLQRPAFDNSSLEASVSNILNEVKLNGDEALRKFASMFDKVTLTNLLVSKEDTDKAESLLQEDLKEAIQQGKSNIEKFHAAQLQAENVIETMTGIR